MTEKWNVNLYYFHEYENVFTLENLQVSTCGTVLLNEPSKLPFTNEYSFFFFKEKKDMHKVS